MTIIHLEAAQRSMNHAVADLRAAGMDKEAYALVHLIGVVAREIEHRESVKDHPDMFSK